MAIHIADADSAAAGPTQASAYGWLVFALSFGLLMSDHMARQVLNAVGPLLKTEWTLSDAEVASLSSVVALAVGLLTLPLSLAADRFGRVRSLFAMACLWSLATIGAAYATSYQEMLLARLLVGVGEAAYGSVGIAVVLAVFPVTMRATLSSSFLAGSVFGQVAGVMVGGQVAAVHGWRAAFEVIGVAGLVLAVLYPLVVRESRLGTPPMREKLDWRLLGQQLLGRRIMLLAYFASGIQLFCTGTLAVFLPLLLTRHYGLKIDQAGQATALFLLICAVGMVACGLLADRVARKRPAEKPRIAMLLSLITAALFAGTFFSAPGPVQLGLLGAGLFVVAGNAGIAGAMIANLTPRAIHGTAMAVLALANNLIGLAPGPLITGWLSDRIGLLDALKILPLPCLLCAVAMAFARSDYARAVAPDLPKATP
jgi:MFS family permease